MSTINYFQEKATYLELCQVLKDRGKYYKITNLGIPEVYFMPALELLGILGREKITCLMPVNAFTCAEKKIIIDYYKR